MISRIKFSAAYFFIMSAIAFSASALATGVDDLGKSLTPFGAERAGNADKTIPAWEGGYTTVDPSYQKGGKRGDPFAADKPLFSITSKNMAQYADKLSDGVKEMFKRYPDTYRMARSGRPRRRSARTRRSRCGARVLRRLRADAHGASRGSPARRRWR